MIFFKMPKNNLLKNVDTAQISSSTSLTQKGKIGPVKQVNTKPLEHSLNEKPIPPVGRTKIIDGKDVRLPIKPVVLKTNENISGNPGAKGDVDAPREHKDFGVVIQRPKRHHHHHIPPQTIIEDENDSSNESTEKTDENTNIDQSIRKALENLEICDAKKTNQQGSVPESQAQPDKPQKSSNPPSLNEFPIVNRNKIRRVATGTDLPSHMYSRSNSPSFKRESSVRSLRGGYFGEKLGSEYGDSDFSKPFSDMVRIRSWASVGLGSTDGKKMIIRRVPTSPEELFTIVNPPTPPEEYLYDADSDEDNQEDGDSSYSKPIRHQWANKLQFVLACVGYSVGLSSVWRFPYLCYKSGGGVFLIPYFITMLVCGVPLLYMELAVGQYTGRGPIGALGHLCPIFIGTGLGSVVISFLMSTYYSVIIAYGIYYFFTSFKSKHPWADCNHKWNTPNCWVNKKSNLNNPIPMNSQTPSEEFFEIKVLQAASGIEQFHQLRWELVACLICAWVLVYFAIWKSIKSSGRVRYFTATLPFVLIILFLAKSLTLEGADKGLRYFFKPKWRLLGQAKVWVNAAAQTFNSMGIAFGSMISFASYNKYNNNILRDTVAVSVVNLVTSLLVGIFAFATIGNIATEHNKTVEDVITDGPGLIFVIYPQAIAKMPAANLWAILFFFMLLCLALNSQFATVEVVVTSIHDGFPVWIKNHLMCHEILVLVVCVISLIFGLPYVTQSGIYFFQLMDHYTATISKMYLAFFEVVAIAWVYGGQRLSNNVKTMTGKYPGWYFKFCWVIAAPLMIISLWVFLLIDYAPPTYNNGYYEYPSWAIALGWGVASLSLLCIPFFMVYVFIMMPGETLTQKLKNSIQPQIEDKCQNCEDMDCECIIEDRTRPMLVLQRSDVKGKTCEPFYIPVQELDNHKNNGIAMTDFSETQGNCFESNPIVINTNVETHPTDTNPVNSEENKV